MSLVFFFKGNSGPLVLGLLNEDVSHQAQQGLKLIFFPSCCVLIIEERHRVPDVCVVSSRLQVPPPPPSVLLRPRSCVPSRAHCSGHHEDVIPDFLPITVTPWTRVPVRLSTTASWLLSNSVLPVPTSS